MQIRVLVHHDEGINMVIRMAKEEEKTNIGEIREARQKAVDSLVEYLKTFHPERPGGDSKHSLMGPVGKLLSRITTTGDISWGSVKGYVLSVHKNQQGSRGVSAEGAERLEAAIDALEHLRLLMPSTKWLKTVEDLDDEVFFGVYKTKLVGQRKGVQKKFQAWLKGKYGTIDRLNELLESEPYTSFDDVEDPFSAPDELKKVVDEFWTQDKRKKEEKS